MKLTVRNIHIVDSIFLYFQLIQRILNLINTFRSYMSVNLCRLWTGMPQQALNIPDVRAVF